MSRISIVIASAIVLSMTGVVYADPPDHSSANRATIADIKRDSGEEGSPRCMISTTSTPNSNKHAATRHGLSIPYSGATCFLSRTGT